jgi:CRISPR/Cas system-associated exonuclease Cas4 (RecB family)
MQTSAYAVMFEERTGIPVDRLVILIAIDEQPNCSVFIEKRDDWIGEFLELRETYSKLKGH